MFLKKYILIALLFISTVKLYSKNLNFQNRNDCAIHSAIQCLSQIPMIKNHSKYKEIFKNFDINKKPSAEKTKDDSYSNELKKFAYCKAVKEIEKKQNPSIKIYTQNLAKYYEGISSGGHKESAERILKALGLDDLCRYTVKMRTEKGTENPTITLKPTKKFITLISLFKPNIKNKNLDFKTLNKLTPIGEWNNTNKPNSLSKYSFRKFVGALPQILISNFQLGTRKLLNIPLNYTFNKECIEEGFKNYTYRLVAMGLKSTIHATAIVQDSSKKWYFYDDLYKKRNDNKVDSEPCEIASINSVLKNGEYTFKYTITTTKNNNIRKFKLEKELEKEYIVTTLYYQKESQLFTLKTYLETLKKKLNILKEKLNDLANKLNTLKTKLNTLV